MATKAAKTLKELVFEGKVSPEAMQIMYLDEISGKLGDIEQRLLEMGDGLENMRSEMTKAGVGISDSFRVSATSTDTIMPLTESVISALVINDGPNGVYCAVNKSAYGDAPLLITESIVLDLHTPGIKQLRFVCLPGQTARLRVFVVR